MNDLSAVPSTSQAALQSDQVSQSSQQPNTASVTPQLASYDDGKNAQEFQLTSQMFLSKPRSIPQKPTSQQPNAAPVTLQGWSQQLASLNGAKMPQQPQVRSQTILDNRTLVPEKMNLSYQQPTAPYGASQSWSQHLAYLNGARMPQKSQVTNKMGNEKSIPQKNTSNWQNMDTEGNVVVEFTALMNLFL